MSTIERYRKKGGYLQLLMLIESSPKEKQERFLEMIQRESPRWTSELQKRLLSMDKIIRWPDEALREVLTRLQPLQLASAFYPYRESHKQRIFVNMNRKDCRAVEDFWDGKVYSHSEISGSQQKVFTEIRKLVTETVLKWESIDPDMLIPSDIESELDLKTMIEVTPIEVNEVPVESGSDSAAAEVFVLRRKVQALAQENVKLQQENRLYRDKLEQIKKIA